MLKNRTVQFLFSKYLFISFLVTTLIIPAISLADADRIFKENSKAVVVVIAYDKQDKPISQGSGFIVRPDGAIVTNYHVISNAVDIKVKVGDKLLKVEGLLHIDKENDIVILKAKGKDLSVIKIGDIEKVSVGEKVYVISSPEGLENTISDGVLSGIRELDPKRKILQITAPISKGSSGGPVFNKNGEVIGIATFLIEEAQNLNFAIPVNLIKDKISARKVAALKDVDIEDYKKIAAFWLMIGLSYEADSLFKEAIEAYKQAVRVNPDFTYAHAYAHNRLGIAYSKSGMYREAMEAFKQAIRIEPDYAEAYNNLGKTYVELGMYREAIEACKQAIRIKPGFAMAHYGLGLTYLLIDNRGLALEQYKILKSLDPKLADHLFNFIYK
ncbi:MAG: hypothetical protein COS27_04730 [Nitrospirae bacterium CG02_land_8_20_14_3_00_41_53]|nr:MAG: hypothetical protein COS27_04730 [Nitrospirae bacterium CG02_land_8_20_14_3_00_41_53]